jgi:hypothetical protein
VQIAAHVTFKGLAPRPGIDALVEHEAGEHRDPADDSGDGKLMAAVREAFVAARTQLVRYAAPLRHEPRPRGTASRL